MDLLFVLLPATPPAVRSILGLLTPPLMAPWGVGVSGFTVTLLCRPLGPPAIGLVLFGHEPVFSTGLAVIRFICTNPPGLAGFVRG